MRDIVEHGKYTSLPGDEGRYECGCHFIHGVCTKERMCEGHRSESKAVHKFLTETDEGKARVAGVRAEAAKNGLIKE